MKLTIIKAPGDIPTSTLESRGEVKEPVGSPIAHIHSSSFHEHPEIGVWECSPGKWRRQVRSAEFCHFVAGRCIFHADGEKPIHISAGDAVLFPPNTTGTWEILETVRKTYVLLGDPD
ncbi:MAG TPA: cupin domain-containing protein [Alphaproteobacteria bacterium]|nr:cupin domain-containing protein [Alphaproteobacteria bacterium]